MKKEGTAKETERNGHSQRRNPRDDFLETDGKINMHEGGVICFPRTVKLSLPIALSCSPQFFPVTGQVYSHAPGGNFHSLFSACCLLLLP